MGYQDLLVKTIERLSAPDFRMAFLGVAVVLFLTIHFGGRRGLGKEIHKMISLVLSLGLALLIAAASIGLGGI